MQIKKLITSRASINEGMRFLMGLCREAYPEVSHACPPITDVDKLAIQDWVDQILNSVEAYAGPWQIRSVLFAIITVIDDLGNLAHKLEGTGRSFAAWDDADDDVFYPPNCELQWEPLQSLLAPLFSLEDGNAQSELEYVLGLGLAGLGLAEAIDMQPRPFLMDKRVYLCWSGGDELTIV
jgi:hypothetical protein